MNTEDSEFARLEHEALLRAAKPEQPSKAGELSDDDCRDIYNAAMYLPNRNIVSVMRYIIAHTVAQPLQERLAELHLYEEINEHYAKCNSGAENLRDWVAERMDTESVQPVLHGQNTEAEKVAFALGMSCRPASVQRPWVGLTVQEIGAIWDADGTGYIHEKQLQFYMDCETKLREKNI